MEKLRSETAYDTAEAMSLLDVTREIQTALAALRRGQTFINEEIARLEAFLASGTAVAVAGAPKRRGRPPKALAAAAAAVPGAPVKRGPGRPRKNPEAAVATAKAPSKRKWSEAARDAARKRMKDYWAKKKKKG